MQSENLVYVHYPKVWLKPSRKMGYTSFICDYYCDIDVPIMRDIYEKSFDANEMAKPTDVAETYWWAHHQPKGAWSNEIELRPYTEKWSY